MACRCSSVPTAPNIGISAFPGMVASSRAFSFGTYPDVSLRQARQPRDEARALVTQGIDPRQHRQQSRRVVSLAAENTFKAVLGRWVEFRRHSLKEGRQTTLAQLQRIRMCCRISGNAPYTRHQALRSLGSAGPHREAEGTDDRREMPCMVQPVVSLRLGHGGGLAQNPAIDLDVVALPKPPVSHHPFLRMAELPSLLAKLRRDTTETLCPGSARNCL